MFSVAPPSLPPRFRDHFMELPLGKAFMPQDSKNLLRLVALCRLRRHSSESEALLARILTRLGATSIARRTAVDALGRKVASLSWEHIYGRCPKTRWMDGVLERGSDRPACLLTSASRPPAPSRFRRPSS